MPRASVQGIEIEYAVQGDLRTLRPLVLIRGLSTQMIHWDPDWLNALVEAGHAVITFDNRDVGLSTHCTPPHPKSHYSLGDMAGDVTGLMDHLDLPKAHVVGISMGGMIAQRMAIDGPERVASLTSIMSTSGDPGLPGPTDEALKALMKPPAHDRAGYIADQVRNGQVFHGPSEPFDEVAAAQKAGEAFDRAFDPAGVARQMSAIQRDPPRGTALAQVRMPALVIHGSADPLVPAPCGQATADALPSARFLLIEGMGHDLPRSAWPEILGAVSALTASVPG